MKKTYRIYATELAHYSFEIEANSEDEAMQLAFEHDFTTLEPNDYSGFQVDSAELVNYERA